MYEQRSQRKLADNLNFIPTLLVTVFSILYKSSVFLHIIDQKIVIQPLQCISDDEIIKIFLVKVRS